MPPGSRAWRAPPVACGWRSPRERRLALPLFAVLLAAAPLAAQPAPDPTPLPPPVTLSYADGRVDVVRPDGVEAARVPDLLEDDDRLVVADGRAELVFDDGTLVHVDRDTDLRIDPDVQLRLVHGRVVVHTTRMHRSWW